MEISKDKDVVVLKLQVEDLSDPGRTSRVVEKLLREDGERKIVADLSRIENIYSVQIGTLVTIHCMCYENVAVMKLAGANEKIKTLLRMVGLETLMELHHGASVAVESFGSACPAVSGAGIEGGTQNERPAKPLDPRVKR